MCNASSCIFPLRIPLCPSALLLLILFVGCGSPLFLSGASAQTFLPDDPVWDDPDRAHIDPPEARDLYDFYDFYENAVLRRGESGGAAMNVNTLGEVPRSSWYVPRHYYDRLSLEELTRGSLTEDDLDRSEPWRVVEGKDEGTTTGFWVDAGEHRHLFKFDAPGHLELSTGSEAAVTRFFHAFGYHTPENYLVHFERDQLAVGENAMFTDDLGRERQMTEGDLDTILSQVPQYDDGRYRAVASRFIPGSVIGPFKYHGTRPDDPNDLFPHEHRRELRGMRVFAAWLGRVDSRSNNTLDSYVEEDGRGFVRHYMIDHTTTFGATPLGPKRVWHGKERIIDVPTVLTSALTLGWAGRPWNRFEYSDHPAVGRFDTVHFHPEKWKPEYHNPAFQNMDADDAFWAAKQVAHFTEADIRALLAAAEYSDPAVEDELTTALLIRRDKIARAYLPHGGGIDRFHIEEDTLHFDDLLDHPAFDEPPAPFAPIQWHVFDNDTGTRGPVHATTSVRNTKAPLPHTSDAAYVVGQIRRVGAPDQITEVYVRLHTSAPTVVGVRRLADGPDASPPVWTTLPEKPPTE